MKISEMNTRRIVVLACALGVLFVIHHMFQSNNGGNTPVEEKLGSQQSSSTQPSAEVPTPPTPALRAEMTQQPPEEEENSECSKNVFHPSCYLAAAAAAAQQQEYELRSPSPFFKPSTATPDEKQHDAFLCNTHRSGVDPGQKSNNNDRFKKATAWMFPRWWDFGADENSKECETQRKSSGDTTTVPEMRGSHVRGGFYKLENFCLRPSGHLAGFNPKLEEFQGATEAFGINDVDPERGIRQFLENAEPLYGAANRKLCFHSVDNNRLVLFPITRHSENVGHAFHRAGSLLRFIEAAFGHKARDQQENVTIAYVVTNEASDLVARGENAARYFYEVVGTSHFAVVSEAAAQRSVFSNLLSPAARDIAGDDIMKCFKSALIWQNSHVLKAKRLEEQRTAFHLFGPRTMRDVETLRLLDTKLRSCRQLAPRRTQVNPSKPHVILSVRSRLRRLSLQPFLIAKIAEFVHNELHGTFEVIEHINLSFAEIIERHSKADILLGMLGAGLIWTQFMPPGAVLIEFNFRNYRCAATSGVNENPACDFGGAAATAQQFHVAISNDLEPLLRFPFGRGKGVSKLRGRLARQADLEVRKSTGGTDFAAGPNLVQFALERAQCLLQHGQQNVALSRVLQPVPERCAFSQKEVNDAAKKDIDDLAGENLAAVFRIAIARRKLHLLMKQMKKSRKSTSSSSFNSSETAKRLHAVVDHADQIATATRPLRWRAQPPGAKGGDPDSVPMMTVLLILDGKATADLRHEIDAWRSYFPLTYRMMVMEKGGVGGNEEEAEADADDGKDSSSSSSSLKGVTVCTAPCHGWAGPFDLVVKSDKAAASQLSENAGVELTIKT